MVDLREYKIGWANVRRKALAKFFSKLIFMKGVNNGMRTPTCVQYTHWLVTARSLHSAASALVSSENSAKRVLH